MNLPLVGVEQPFTTIGSSRPRLGLSGQSLEDRVGPDLRSQVRLRRDGLLSSEQRHYLDLRKDSLLLVQMLVAAGESYAGLS